ncbi:hypothetical protein [Intrasporangium flavum]|uniref:hypothetical protein n=1 Tax=Intrasporangium flavum TaxID=1428657 RepID=UPI00096E41DA|nr:hypothetical protein [Intrasporangium flavum]
MDNTVVAAWIGFGGAFIGGGMAWLGGWLTMRSQWTRERSARQIEQLADMLDTTTRRLADNPPRNEGSVWVTDVTQESMRNLHFVRVMAAAASPHLLQLVEEIFLDEDAEYRPFIPSTDVRVLNGIVARWWPDPKGFEERAASLEEYRLEFPWTALTDRPADPVTSMAVRITHRLRRGK